MQYVVVFRDHDNQWHAVAGPVDWPSALAAARSMVLTLAAIDYYDDFPPSVAKIVSAEGAGQEYYDQAPAQIGQVN